MKLYMKFIAKVNPPKWWQVLRAVLHWVTLPLKLLIIGGLGMAMIVRHMFLKTRSLPALPDEATRKARFQKMYSNLPVFYGANMELYTSRVPYHSLPDGNNHNDDHQGGRHGTYVFIASQLQLRTPKQEEGLRMHMQRQSGFARGFKKDERMNGEIIYNRKSPAGDQILGLCLGMLGVRESEWAEGKNGSVIEVKQGSSPYLLQNFEESVQSIIDNDYANLDFEPKDEWAQELFEEEKQKLGSAAELVRIKSARAMWQPGLETVGAQSITVLAILRTAEKKTKSKYAGEHYRLLLWRYGYGLLSLFPTAFIPSRRAYFNDHNCIVAAYILAKLADSKLGRLWWTAIMYYIWLLSYKQYNGYFTGLLKDVAPWLVSASYVKKCKQYLYEEEPQFSYIEYIEGPKVTYPPLPVKLSEMNQGGEFMPDEEQKKKEGGAGEQVRGGLGWVAAAVMIDPKEAKKFMGRV